MQNKITQIQKSLLIQVIKNPLTFFENNVCRHIWFNKCLLNCYEKQLLLLLLLVVYTITDIVYFDSQSLKKGNEMELTFSIFI